MVRVDGTLRPMNRGPIDDEEMVRLCFPLMNERNRKIFERDGGADFAHTFDVDGTMWRFRVNLLQQLGHVGLVARRVNSWIPDFEGLNLPPSIEKLCTFDQGHDPAGRRHGFGQEHDDRVDAQLDQSALSASTFSRSKTRSSSCSPRTSA